MRGRWGPWTALSVRIGVIIHPQGKGQRRLKCGNERREEACIGSTESKIATFPFFVPLPSPSPIPALQISIPPDSLLRQITLQIKTHTPRHPSHKLRPNIYPPLPQPIQHVPARRRPNQQSQRRQRRDLRHQIHTRHDRVRQDGVEDSQQTLEDERLRAEESTLDLTVLAL